LANIANTLEFDSVDHNSKIYRMIGQDQVVDLEDSNYSLGEGSHRCKFWPSQSMDERSIYNCMVLNREQQSLPTQTERDNIEESTKHVKRLHTSE